MTVRVITGDSRIELPKMAAQSVQCCVCSPPYFGLRDYGTARWEGGDAACGHVERVARQDAETIRKIDALSGRRPAAESYGDNDRGAIQFRGTCGKCGATRVDSQIGLEATPDAYVADLVAVFREVRRVLRDDGTLWLNLGSSYATSGGERTYGRYADGMACLKYTYKAKDLIPTPWLVAMALQRDGWYLRSDIIWNKCNPMPESVTDRPTKSHEYLFLLAKAATYYYDHESIKEPATDTGRGRDRRAEDERARPPGSRPRTLARVDFTERGRNKRSVWTVPLAPFSGDHFATFPPALIEPCILAGSSAKACETCGAPWKRETEYERLAPATPSGHREVARGDASTDTSSVGGRRRQTHSILGPGCPCETNTGAGRSLVLDPFLGAGTTAVVADRLGRDCVGIELNPAYAELTRRRLEADAGLFNPLSDALPAYDKTGTDL